MDFLCGNHKDLAKVFGSRIFFSRFLKYIGWYGFSYGFVVVA
jgi:hypothetical protein